MTSQLFSTFLIDPDLANSQSLRLIEDIVTRFPYCQTGQLLLARVFYVEENMQYSNQLRRAAAYAGDRRCLRELIDRAIQHGSLPGEPLAALNESAPAPLPASESLSDATVGRFFYPEPAMPAIEAVSPANERITQEELLAIVKKRLAEIDAEKRQRQELPVDRQDLQTSDFRLPASGFVTSKSSLIEKFIQDEPRISKPKSAFFSPTDSAIRSNFDEEEIVSETLAQLYAQQGNVQKAIHIYDKLSLLNQEKSRYFAAQIEKLSS